MRKTPRFLLVAVTASIGLVLASCGSDPSDRAKNPQDDLPEQTIRTTTENAAPQMDRDSLPQESNTEINWSDPTDVAKKWLEFRTTFLASDISNPNVLIERSNVATTDEYRERSAPVANPDIVRTGSWFNAGEDPDDPIVLVTSLVELAERANPVFADDVVTQRVLRTEETPVAASGKKSKPRKQRVEVSLKKVEDRWLVDDARFTNLDD